MIPILYAPNEENFKTNGIGALSDCTSCFVDENMDTGEYELELTYEKGGQFFDEIKYGSTIKALPRDNEPAQLFDVYDIVDNMNGTVEVYARHVRFRLHGMPCKPFSASSLEGALAALNTNAFGGNTGFTFETDKASTTAYSLTAPLSVGEVLRGVRGSILDVYGGKFVYNNFTVSLNASRGVDSGVTIRYGKNLTDLTVETEGVAVTGILPYWYSENDGLVYADSVVTVENEAYLPFKYHEVVDYSDDFDEKPSKAQLIALARLDLATGYPKVSYDIKFEPLYKNQEFELLKQFEKIGMGDTVRVVHPDMGINIKARAYRIKYNVLAEKYDTISIGDYKESFASTIARIDTNNGGGSSSSGGGAVAANIPTVCKARGSNASTTSGTSVTQVTLSDVRINTDSTNYSISSGGIKVAKDGLYEVSASAYITPNSNTTTLGTYIKKGSTFASADEQIGCLQGLGATGARAIPTGPVFVNLASNDIVFLGTRCRGTAGTCDATNMSTFLQIMRIGERSDV